MKKILLWMVLILFLSGIVVASYKPIKEALKENPVERTISFRLYKGSNYSTKIYNCSSAEIYIAVEKVKNTSHTTVWDTTFDAKLLNKYPSAKNVVAQKVTIQNVIENKEHLEMHYVLKYNSKGSVLKIQSPSFVLDEIDTLLISL
jgi:hypothetical protein